jgi:hypothetical protein
MSTENFLSRWSRRKQALRTTEQLPEGAVPDEGKAAPETAPETVAPLGRDEPIALSEPELSPDEIAKLPSLESLTADTDISVFLRKGVPEPLRNAALRRMWSLDPKIRDFVCEAREYAYDWNTPGGVPGSGPLLGTEDVARWAARIVTGELSEAVPSSEGKPASKDREQLSSQDASKAEVDVAAPQENRRLASNEAPLASAPEQSSAMAPIAAPESDKRQESAQPERPRTNESAAAASLRRHGGAMPV